jgi:cysteine-rich repeat protein
VGRTELKQITMWVDHSMQPPTYHLYVSATNDTVCHDAQDIYYLTSTSPPTWTNHGVVLSASEPHESRGIEPDHIVKRDQEYLLYYTAFDGSGCNITDKQVALATSSDGVSWQKQGLVIESSTRTTDTEGVGRARVFKRSDGFHMSYQEQDGTNNDIYYAWSADGLNWTRNDAPLIQGSQAWEGTDPRLWPIGFTNSNNQVELFYGAHDGSYQGAGLATTSTLCEFTCGNGVVEGLESCDDGGTTPGDGCDGQCQVELDWSCGGEPSLCTSDSDPTAYAPGTFIPVSIGGTSPRLNSVFRSAGGTLFVGADQDVSGNPRVARSNDGGQSWNTQLLSNAGQSTYRTSIFAIEPGLLGVCGTQGSGSPYDGFMQTSSNDGVSWSGTWDNVSVSSDYNGERYVFVVATPGGRYLAVFRCGTRLCARVHTSYSGWSSTTRFYVDDGTRVLGRPFPFTVGTDVYIAVVNRDDLQLRTYRSTNDGDSFSLIGESPVAEEMDQIRVFYHPVEDLIYLCGASMRNPAVNQRIYTYRSDDDGQTWGDEKLFVSGLDTDNIFTCHIDETGVYGGYQTTGGQIYIIPPGDRVLCGNGVMEPGELCDGADTGGMACGDVGFTTGTLGCASGCTQYDTSNCQ